MSGSREITFEFEQEEDGRWIAELPTIPGALCYGATKKEAAARLAALVMRILADRIEHGEEIPAPFAELFSVPA
ncbi:MAG: type II toxin-antitoxin system HicB family antitoxin [Terrimicrobiaceae bacterium]|jgi:predicted RNase H-like HicB family nuclease